MSIIITIQSDNANSNFNHKKGKEKREYLNLSFGKLIIRDHSRIKFCMVNKLAI